MQEFKFGADLGKSLKKLNELIEEGMSYGIDLSSIKEKIESVKRSVGDGIIRIVLLGSFADGKTSAVAGLLGRLEDTMKIDIDESSDELTIYRPAGLKKGFEIVDTPGLFGTKEREIDGRNIKYSDITKNYLSEAHIVIYVCDAVTPLKDSHVPIIKWIMRDLNKLSSTIFVINKMDEAGYDLTDEEDFANGTTIKKNNLISRLRNAINLTPTEESKLHIVCIAADPKGKGLQYWFAKEADYMHRSHIGLLRNELNIVIDNSDAAFLHGSVADASMKDMLTALGNQVDGIIKPTSKGLQKVNDSCADLKQDVTILKSELDLNRRDMEQQMDNYKSSLISDIKGASLETISEVIERALGVKDGQVTFYVFERNIDGIMKGAQNAASKSINNTAIKFEREFNAQADFMKGAMEQGIGALKNVKVTNTQVLQMRDMFFKNYKFKPWGATNVATKFMKWTGRITVVLSVLIEAYSWYKKWKNSKELDEIKRQLCAALDAAFQDIYKEFAGEAFYDNFAPQMAQMNQQLQEREEEVKNLKKKVEELEKYKTKISSFIKSDAIDTDYQEF